MNEEIDELLQSLRQAMYEALARAGDVADAMARLEQEGYCPTLLVDVSLADQPPPTNRETKVSKTVVLTEYDQQFLRAINIARPF